MKVFLNIAFSICFILFCPYSGEACRADTTFNQPRQNNSNTLQKSSPDTINKIEKIHHGIGSLIFKNADLQNANLRSLSFQYSTLESNRGKTIVSIHYQELDPFGHTFMDTTKVARTKIGRFGNRIHTNTRLNRIKKNVFVREGDKLKVDEVLENERIIRSLPYVEDVRFFAIGSKTDTTKVDLLVITKDVFSFGVGGHFSGTKSATYKIYNQNLFGLGHQITLKVVNNIEEKPYVGMEGIYSIKNICSKYFDVTIGYSNTYKKEGFYFNLDKEFLFSTTKWGGGLSGFRMTRAENIINYDDLKTDSIPLNYKLGDSWLGYALLLHKQNPMKRMQLVLAMRYCNLKFYDRSLLSDKEYYSNSNFFLGSISLSKRNYVRDYLIYSYGITEDIPKGFLNEIVFGYDNNEFIKRLYTHLYLSTSNILPYSPAYVFVSAGLGGFYNSHKLEQGMFELHISYISRLMPLGLQKIRQFLKIDYMTGIKRFENEKIYLKDDLGLRGMYSSELTGNRRLSLNSESVIFQKKAIGDFHVALFGFYDCGFIGSKNKFILAQNFYSGFGFGVRLRNENLVFRTLQFRLGFYPNYPSDAHFFDVYFAEMSKTKFPSFQPREPEILKFK